MKKEFIVLFLILAFALFLRTIGTNLYPPGFTGDEAVFGFNAYSILKTGKDEYGTFLPLFLRAFGDYRPPAYTYLSIPFIFIFGLNEFSTRLLSLVVSLLSIILIYKLSLLIFKKKKAAFFSSFFLATSSWHILFSRMAIMSMLSGFFISLGGCFFFYWLEKRKSRFLIFSSISFVMAIYSYHNARVTVPLLLLSFSLLFSKKIKKFKKIVIVNLLFGFFLLLPLILVFIRSSGKMLRRGIYQSFWHRGDVQAVLLNDRRTDNPRQHPLITKFLHPKQFYFLKEFLRRYTQHFNFSYLFLKGDPHGRFQIPGVGLMNLALAPPFFYGLYKIIKNKNRVSFILLIWLLISPLVASQGINTPNSLHTFDSIIPYYLIIGFGFSVLLQGWYKWACREKVITGVSFLLVFIYYFWRFIHGYFNIIPNSHEYVNYWDYGMKDLMEKVEDLEGDYVQISFIGRIYHEFLIFYRKYEPIKYQDEVIINPVPDELGFEYVVKFNKYIFPRNWQEIEKKANVLYIADERDVSEGEFFKLADCKNKEKKLFLREREVLYFPDNVVAFRIFDIPKDQKRYKEYFCKEYYEK